MADISKIKTLDGTTYDIKDSTARSSIPAAATAAPLMDGTAAVGTATKYAREDHRHPTDTSRAAASHTHSTQDLTRPTGLRGLGDVTLQTLINTTRANRLAFLPADQIIIEKTTDGGTTWVNANIADSTKVGLFSETRAGIPLPLVNGVRSTLAGVRVTISAMKYNVPSGTTETNKYNYWSSSYVNVTERYCQLKEFYFWLSASNDTISVKIERATGASPNNWQTCFNDSSFYMTGWSGCDYVKLNGQGTFGGGINQTGNYWNYRLTFMTRGVNGTDTMGTGYETQTQSIMEVRAYGDTWWTKPNEYMANDKIYTHDYLQNVTFPAKVTATSFVGNLTGNVSGTAANVTGVVAVANGGSGKTTAKDAANVFLNGLDTGSSTPVDADYYISQYVGGGNTTTTYHRRPVSALWEYIKGKISSILGLTATSYGGSAAKVNNHTVAVDVPANAIFTDTNYVPSGGSSGQVLTKSSSTDYDVEWSTVQAGGGLPEVTTSDNGKFLSVVNGEWAAVELQSASGVSF